MKQMLVNDDVLLDSFGTAELQKDCTTDSRSASKTPQDSYQQISLANDQRQMKITGGFMTMQLDQCQLMSLSL
jgi:hypothetical protein